MRRLLDQHCCIVNMDSNWYADRKNNTKQKHETPLCGIPTHQIGRASHASAGATREESVGDTPASGNHTPGSWNYTSVFRNYNPETGNHNISFHI